MRSRCAQPTMADSGVRSSCDSVAMNSSRMRTSASALRRASCSRASSSVRSRSDSRRRRSSSNTTTAPGTAPCIGEATPPHGQRLAALASEGVLLLGQFLARVQAANQRALRVAARVALGAVHEVVEELAARVVRGHAEKLLGRGVGVPHAALPIHGHDPRRDAGGQARRERGLAPQRLLRRALSVTSSRNSANSQCPFSRRASVSTSTRTSERSRRRTRMARRPAGAPSPVFRKRSRSARQASRSAAGRSRPARSRPNTSSSVHPNSRAARAFQKVTAPASSMPTTAAGDVSTSRCSLSARASTSAAARARCGSFAVRSARWPRAAIAVTASELQREQAQRNGLSRFRRAQDVARLEEEIVGGEHGERRRQQPGAPAPAPGRGEHGQGEEEGTACCPPPGRAEVCTAARRRPRRLRSRNVPGVKRATS